MSERKQRSARIQLILVALVFFGPLIAAAWLYFGGHFDSGGERTNHGILLEPFVNLGESLPAYSLQSHNEGHWMLVYANAQECADDCRAALYTTRQSRTMLGKEMDRVTRVFLHGPMPPDTVFLAGEHKGLVSLEDPTLAELLDNKKPADIPAGGYFLVDPHGNLVMYFQPDVDPADMVDDVKHLLRLSRIG
jgi:hypothetical protein